MKTTLLAVALTVLPGCSVLGKLPCQCDVPDPPAALMKVPQPLPPIPIDIAPAK